MKKTVCSAISLIASLFIALPAFANDKVLKLGSQDSEIAYVQNVLQRQGYLENFTNGFFDLNTLSALIEFQEDENLYISGTVDSETRSRLYDTGTQTVYTQEDLYWLSRIVHAESSGESYLGKVAVANCVLNRVKSQDYPNTIKEVIFDTNHGVQYQPTQNGTIYNTPDEISTKAAIDALNGINPVGDSIFFFNPSIATNFWISENREFYTSIGNHSFYL